MDIHRIPAADAQPEPMVTAARWTREISGLVSPPDVCLRIFELVETNRASAQALADIIALDPSLTARLLRIVNSSFFHFSRRIDTVSRAITVIGVSELYNLVIAVSAIKSFSNIPSFIVNIDTFWRHSIYCGLIARVLARRCNVLHPERLFVAGLLHDIGSLVLYNRAPEACKDLLLAARGNECILYQTERREFGFSHAEIGGLLLDLWHLPPALHEAVRYHHTPAAAARAPLETAIVHIADALANQSELGAFCAMPATDLFIDETAWGAAGLRGEAELVCEVTEEARAHYRDAVNAFCD